MKKIAKNILLVILCISFTLPPQRSEAAVPLAILEIIKAAVKKVIVAMDLKIQRQQNKVIWLQNAQKVLENAMSKLKLDEIGEWTEKQRTLYKDYFDELQKVKTAITYYQRVQEISSQQARMVSEYQQAWSILQKDPHFSAEEISYMGQVYAGMMQASLQNIDQLMQVVGAFTVQMNDAERLAIINDAADRVDATYRDLVTFNRSNAYLSLQRSHSQGDINKTRLLYGIE